jgi:hypothetical protein
MLVMSSTFLYNIVSCCLVTFKRRGSEVAAAAEASNNTTERERESYFLFLFYFCNDDATYSIKLKRILD